MSESKSKKYIAVDDASSEEESGVEITVSEALEEIGFGRFQWVVVFLCGFYWRFVLLFFSVLHAGGLLKTAAFCLQRRRVRAATDALFAAGRRPRL